MSNQDYGPPTAFDRSVSFSIRNPQFAIRNCICLAVFTAVLLAGCRLRPEPESAQDGYQWPERILTAAESSQEAAEKLSRTLALLKREQLGGLLIESAADFSWITAGSEAAVPVFVRADGRRFLLTTASEGVRLLDGDLKGMGYELSEIRWESAKADREAALMSLSAGQPFAADSGSLGGRMLGEAVAALRAPLTDTEIRKYRWLGPKCAQAIESVCRRVEPGMTEKGIEVLVSCELLRHTIRPESVCVATDERINRESAGRSSEDAKLEKALRIRVCAQRWGLHVSLTRMVHFGPVPEEMEKAAEAAAAVNAGLWARTLPDAKAASILQDARADYAKAGYAGDWARGDQGGAIGYLAPDWVATPESSRSISSGQAFAWCPTVHGVRIEDTMLLDGDNLQILTRTADWPVIESRALGHIYRSAGILVR
jgi:antitoxin VapB